MQPSEWKYCALIQDPSTGRLLMFNLLNNQWRFAHEVKQLIDLTPEQEQSNGQVS